MIEENALIQSSQVIIIVIWKKMYSRLLRSVGRQLILETVALNC